MTLQGPVKKQQPDGMSHTGGGGGVPPAQSPVVSRLQQVYVPRSLCAGAYLRQTQGGNAPPRQACAECLAYGTGGGGRGMRAQESLCT